jgi:hypothetical protein
VGLRPDPSRILMTFRGDIRVRRCSEKILLHNVQRMGGEIDSPLPRGGGGGGGGGFYSMTLRLSQGASIKHDESEGCSRISVRGISITEGYSRGFTTEGI